MYLLHRHYSPLEEAIRAGRDPLPDRVVTGAREAFFRFLYCPLAGHARVRKMDGTVLCSRHSGWSARWR